jgi:hypothetical protein
VTEKLVNPLTTLNLLQFHGLVEKVENCKQEVQAAQIFIQTAKMVAFALPVCKFQFFSQLCLSAFKIPSSLLD